MTGGIYEDWGGDEIDLREAEEHDIVDQDLLTQGVTEGTDTVGALTFTAPTALEILALRYRAHLVVKLDTRATTIGSAATIRRGKAFNITTLGTFGRGRVGDYLTEEVLASAAVVLDDETNGVGAALEGNDGIYATLLDPGLDSVAGPLVLGEGETLEVHLRQAGHDAPGSPGEQNLRHRMDIWWQEQPEAQTEVRRRGDFPSSGGAI